MQRSYTYPKVRDRPKWYQSTWHVLLSWCQLWCTRVTLNLTNDENEWIIFLKYSIFCRRSFVQIVVPLPIFTFERLCLSQVLFFTPNHFTILLEMNPISCNMFLQLFLFNITYFTSMLLPPWQLFLAMLLPSNVSSSTFDLLSMLCINTGLWDCILFLFTFYTVPHI